VREERQPTNAESGFIKWEKEKEKKKGASRGISTGKRERKKRKKIKDEKQWKID